MSDMADIIFNVGAHLCTYVLYCKIKRSNITKEREMLQKEQLQMVQYTFEETVNTGDIVQ
jgi:hypothetical protein